MEKDSRANAIEASDLDDVKKDLNDQHRIMEDDIYNRIEKLLLNKMAKVGKKTKKITKDDLEKLNRDKWFGIKLKDKKRNSELESYYQRLKLLEEEFESKLTAAKNKIEASDDLSPGVLKMVKVFLAVKRRIQPGDKIAGRHGNKGVISRIVPVEDMPYMQDLSLIHI